MRYITYETTKKVSCSIDVNTMQIHVLGFTSSMCILITILTGSWLLRLPSITKRNSMNREIMYGASRIKTQNTLPECKQWRIKCSCDGIISVQHVNKHFIQIHPICTLMHFVNLSTLLPYLWRHYTELGVINCRVGRFYYNEYVIHRLSLQRITKLLG